MNYGHLCCIKKEPPHGDIMEVMWLLPQRADFLEDGGVLNGVGKLHYRVLEGLHRWSEQPLARAVEPKFSGISLVTQLGSTLKLLLHHLEFISTTFRATQRIVCETQRVTLELRAFLDYQEFYKPRMDKTYVFSVNTDVMGAFTNDLNVCGALFRAGIPVWLIRPYTEIHSIRVKALTQLWFASGTIPLDPPSGSPFPKIYVGSANCLEKYIAIAHYVSRLLQYPDPFGSVRATPLAGLPPPPAHASASAGSKSLRFTPCNALYSFPPLLHLIVFFEDHNRPQKQGMKDPRAPAGGRDKFEDPQSNIYPPAIPAWRRACQDFNYQRAKFVNDLTPTDLGYIFPEPAAFVSVTPQRQEALFLGWLKYRRMMLYRVSSPDFSAQPMPQGLWRDFLTLEYVKSIKGSHLTMGESSSRQLDRRGPAAVGGSAESTRSHKHRQNAQDFLQNCLNAAEGVELVSANDRLEWNGKTLETPNDLEREEILWELAELNFRFELQALDARATTTEDRSDRQRLITACFPFSKNGAATLLVADLGAANHGLASQNWEEKAPYLQALRKLMATWRGEVPSIIQTEKCQWSKQEIEELENSMADFYICSFYNYFHRAPVVPRGLSHQASLYRIPASPKIKVLDPKPNTFYDVSVLAPLNTAN